MSYHDSFQHVIKRYYRKLMLINLDKNVRCKCHMPGSNDPDPACPKCLGTGYRIRIYEINGAPQTSTNPTTFRQTNQVAIITYFYLLDEQGLNTQAEWISFLETLDFTMIDKSFKSRRSYEQILSTFANTEIKLKKDMTNYLQIGEENYLIYSYYYQLINNKQFSKYSLPQKQYIKEKVA